MDDPGAAPITCLQGIISKKFQAGFPTRYTIHAQLRRREVSLSWKYTTIRETEGYVHYFLKCDGLWLCPIRCGHESN